MFPALCQSLLRSRNGADQPGSRKRERPPEAAASLTMDATACTTDGSLVISTARVHISTSMACSSAGKQPASRTADPGFDPQHAHISPGNWSVIDSSHSLDPVCIHPDDWTLSNLPNVYTPPPPTTATPHFLGSVCVSPDDWTLPNSSNLPSSLPPQESDGN